MTEMTVEQIMTRDVETVPADASVLLAAHKMRDLDIGFLPVCAGDQFVGVVTDRDIVLRALAAGLDPSTTTVSRVMTSEVVGCFQDQSVEAAAQQMNVHRIRRLLIVDQAKNIVGVVSLGDLALDALDDEHAGRVLQTISWPSRPERQPQY